ncbi:MAG TPA: putative Ig domain-containing protein, partial [Candidatus Eisenbacteria bacterium]
AAPVLSGVPASATIPELVAYGFTASASDSDLPAQTLTFSLIGAPPGVSIGSSTGVFSWTPSEAQGPGSYPFMVRVSDGVANTDASITLTVDDVNSAPVLSGVPASATIPELVAYGFTASASDSDLPAQTLTFSLIGAPLGASIGGSSGAFSWTPSEAQGPGSYPFTVRVSDGVANTDAAITLTVEDITIAAISDLAATQVQTGNDSDGTTKIDLSWSATPLGTTVEVYRAGFGSYPEYDDAGGHVPATPSYPPGAPWTLTPITAPGTADEVTTRDFHYYVAFVHGAGANVSTVSNQTSGTLNYHLGDVSNAVTAGQGDNLVNTADVSLLGAHYGLIGPAVAPYAYLDIGPTSTSTTDGLPTTDNAIDFEDLILFAIGFEDFFSPIITSETPAPVPTVQTDEVWINAPGQAVVGQPVTAELGLRGTGKLQGLSVKLEWDPTVVRPISTTSGAMIQQARGVVLAPRPGTLDAALLGARQPGLIGDGSIGSVTFEVVSTGDPRIRIASIEARDARNHKVEVASGRPLVPIRVPTTTSLAPAAPNPFRHGTTLAFALAQPGVVELAVYSVDGRRVRTLIKDSRGPGEYRIVWDGHDDHGNAVGAGIYYARLIAGPRSYGRSMVHVR